MDIHKPKPWHGWRELAKEVGTIVLGVLIAIGFEQAVEALHHRDQARDMAHKLRQESLENRRVVAYDLVICDAQTAAADRNVERLSQAIRDRSLSSVTLAPLSLRPQFRPADAAWITIRDSALLPIMPKLAIDNGWKIEATSEAMVLHSQDANQAGRRLQAALAVAAQRPLDAPLADDILLKLNEFRTEEASYCDMARIFGDTIEKSLAGQRIDLDNALDKPAGGPIPPSPKPG
jgi:hypothetical protein